MIRETEVDGVQALLAPKRGPVVAGLTFRVGRADETLALAGITHLLEHLALFRHGLSDYHYNGTTGSVVTHFHIQGTEADVVGYLNGVCDSLANLPVDRLEAEKGILRTEAAGRGSASNESLPVWRYGAQGYGLVGLPELGLPRLTPADVRHWATTWFTRQNAVFWITSDRIPRGLRLRLPAGIRRPVPRVSSALPVTPAYYQERTNGIVMDAVVRKGTAGVVFARLLEREMFRSLRQEGGNSYVTRTAYDPRGDGFATVTAVADALPDRQDAVLGGLIDALAGFRVGAIAPAELHSVRSRAEEALREPDADAARLPSAAMNVLTGQPNPSADALIEEFRAVTVDDVRQVAVAASRSALLAIPPGLDAEWAGFAPAPTHSARPVSGERFRSRSGDQAELVVGAEGVGLAEDGRMAAVRYAECAIAMAWPDGGRRLIGLDGIMVRIEPTLFPLPGALIARIDASVPPASLVWLPPRDPAAIPRPDAGTSAARRSSGARRAGGSRTASWRARIVAAVTGISAAILGLAMLGADPANPDDAFLRSAGFSVLVGFLVVATVVFGIQAIRGDRAD